MDLLAEGRQSGQSHVRSAVCDVAFCFALYLVPAHLVSWLTGEGFGGPIVRGAAEGTGVV